MIRSYEECGKIVHRPCSSYISSIQEINEDSIEFSLSTQIRRVIKSSQAKLLQRLFEGYKENPIEFLINWPSYLYMYVICSYLHQPTFTASQEVTGSNPQSIVLLIHVLGHGWGDLWHCNHEGNAYFRCYQLIPHMVCSSCNVPSHLYLPQVPYLFLW